MLSLHHTRLTLHNVREKLTVTMITMSFCRAWKTASIYAISFHIGCTIEKITGTIIIIRNVQKWYPLRLFGPQKFFFAGCKRKTKYTAMYRISCSIFLSDPKWYLREWQIYDLIRRYPLSLSMEQKNKSKNFIEMLISDTFSLFFLLVKIYFNGHHHLWLWRRSLNEYINIFAIICWWNILFNLSWSNSCFNKRNRTNKWEWKSIQSTCSMWFSVRKMIPLEFNQYSNLVHPIIMNVNQ